MARWGDYGWDGDSWDDGYEYYEDDLCGQCGGGDGECRCRCSNCRKWGDRCICDDPLADEKASCKVYETLKGVIRHYFPEDTGGAVSARHIERIAQEWENIPNRPRQEFDCEDESHLDRIQKTWSGRTLKSAHKK